MKLIKKGLTKLLLAGVITTAFLGLTACNRGSDNSNEDSRAFGVEDLPEWLRSNATDEEWEEIFNEMTPEFFEYFFTEGLGSMEEEPNSVLPEGSSGYNTSDPNFFYNMLDLIPTIPRANAEELINNIEDHSLLTAEQIAELRSLLDN